MFHSLYGGVELGFLFAFSTAPSQFLFIVDNGTFEESVMIGAGDPDQFVMRWPIGLGLQVFLQFAFGVFKVGEDLQFAEVFAETIDDKLIGPLETGIDEDGSNHRFKCVRQGAGAFPSAAEFFSPAHHQLGAQVDFAGKIRQCAAVHQLGACFRQGAFIVFRIALVKLLSDDQLPHGVSQKLKTLVAVEGFGF